MAIVDVFIEPSVNGLGRVRVVRALGSHAVPILLASEVEHARIASSREGLAITIRSLYPTTVTPER